MKKDRLRLSTFEILQILCALLVLAFLTRMLWNWYEHARLCDELSQIGAGMTVEEVLEVLDDWDMEASLDTSRAEYDVLEVHPYRAWSNMPVYGFSKDSGTVVWWYNGDCDDLE